MQVILSAWHAAMIEIRQGTGMLIQVDRFRVLAVIQFAMGTDAGHCTETLSEFDCMDFVPLGGVKPDFYKGRVAYSVAPSETFLQYEDRKKRIRGPTFHIIST